MQETYVSDKKGKNFLSVAAFIITLVIIKALDVLRQYVSDKFPEYMPDTITLPEKVIIGFMILFAAVYVIYILILLPMWYKKIRYVITDSDIITDTGLFSRTHRVMKLSAVQSCTLVAMPFSKVTGFNFIIVNALGGRIVMMFLALKDCRRIIDLVDKRNKISARRTKAEETFDAYAKRADRKIAEQEENFFMAPLGSSYAQSYNDEGVSSYVQLTFPEKTAPPLFDAESTSEQLSFIDFSSSEGGEGS